ncbi:hypothetical protein CO081_01215 [Candidatus Pacearchaeota archaeon CG_4_9_14_0_8_um_filter_35_24]|nr:MAG: hypothetical protein CO081_01215 [Candidatus Pacearchaeota archaeon CG_4_9_14_0_8_um_filter_35_24]
MKKILMMGLTPPVEGGSERHIYEISSRIPESFVFTQKNSICQNKVTVPIYKKNNFFRNILFLLTSFVYSIVLLITPVKKYDLIHIHENLLYFLTPILKLRYKVIITVHGISGFRFFDNKLIWPAFRYCLSRANKIISVSVADVDNLKKEIENIKYIPNGVDLEFYSKIKPLKVQKKITFIGRIHKQKGTSNLLKAFQTFSKKYPGYNLQIIGKKEGNLYHELKTKYKSDKIIWKGFVSDRRILFKEASSSYLLVFPSIWEALPWPALLEGLGSGRPVIASDLPGMRKIFKDNTNIVLVKPSSVESLEKALIAMAKSPKKANQIGRNGKKTAKKYEWSKIALEVQNLYNTVLSDKRVK